MPTKNERFSDAMRLSIFEHMHRFLQKLTIASSEKSLHIPEFGQPEHQSLPAMQTRKIQQLTMIKFQQIQTLNALTLLLQPTLVTLSSFSITSMT